MNESINVSQWVTINKSITQFLFFWYIRKLTQRKQKIKREVLCVTKMNNREVKQGNAKKFGIPFRI